MHLWQWLRRLISRRDDLLRSLAVLCSYWILTVDCIPRDLLMTATGIELEGSGETGSQSSVESRGAKK